MIIPDKNLFIVTSSVKPAIGAFTDDQRFQQTIDSLGSIREKVPDAIIVTSDVSIRPLSPLERTAIAEKSNFFIDMSQEPNTLELSQMGAKSHAENMLLYHTIMTLKAAPETSKMMNSIKRIFKYSGRTILEDSFDIKEYDNMFGKFVFKKRIPTWMNPPKVSDLFITRLFSFCPSLIDTYIQVIGKNLPLLNEMDTEHAHFANIPDKHLVEFDKIHCWGWLAGNGQIEHY